MRHFPFSLLDLLTFAAYAAYFVFVVWFIFRMVRALKAVEDIGRSLRVMAYDLRELSDDVRALRENATRESARRESPGGTDAK